MEENITSLHTFQISELQTDFSDLETRLEDVEETQNGTQYQFFLVPLESVYSLLLGVHQIWGNVLDVLFYQMMV